MVRDRAKYLAKLKDHHAQATNGADKIPVCTWPASVDACVQLRQDDDGELVDHEGELTVR